MIEKKLFENAKTILEIVQHQIKKVFFLFSSYDPLRTYSKIDIVTGNINLFAMYSQVEVQKKQAGCKSIVWLLKEIFLKCLLN